MNEYQIEADKLIEKFATSYWNKDPIQLATMWCEEFIKEWQHITDTFVSGSVTNEYKLEYWRKIREALLAYGDNEDEDEGVS